MDIREQLATLVGLRSKQLENARGRIVDELEAEALAEFFVTATPAELEKLARVVGFRAPPKERLAACYEATYADGAASSPKSDKLLTQLRRGWAVHLKPPGALALLERHPEDTFLVDSVRNRGTVGELRRAGAIGQPSAEVVALIESLHGAPEGLEVGAAAALVELGCTWTPVPDVAAYPTVYRSGTGEWAGEDPDGQLAPPSGGGWLVERCALFPSQPYTIELRTGDEPCTVRLGQGGEAVDIEVRNRRRVLAPIAYVHETQLYLSVDLTDPSPDPQLFIIDHDGSGPSYYGSVTTFCRRLRRVELVTDEDVQAIT